MAKQGSIYETALELLDVCKQAIDRLECLEDVEEATPNDIEVLANLRCAVANAEKSGHLRNWIERKP